MYKAKINQEEESRVIDLLNRLDLSPIKAKLIHSKGWSIDYANEVEKWYKRFLLLCYKYSEDPVVVNNAIDEFWHNHILDTRKYMEDCNNIFGYYIHHFPYFGMRGEQDAKDLENAFEETNRLYLSEFGETQMKTAMLIEGTFSKEEELNFFQAAACSDCTSGPNACSHNNKNNFSFERPVI